MTRSRLVLWVDIYNGILFIVIVFSLIVGHGIFARFWRSIHIASGILLLAGLITHLGLHMKWIRSVLLRSPKSLPGIVRKNRRVNVWILLISPLCILTGIVNWLSPGTSPMHFPHNWNGLHHLCGLVLILLFSVHLALHWKWIVVNTQRYLIVNGLEKLPAADNLRTKLGKNQEK